MVEKTLQFLAHQLTALESECIVVDASDTKDLALRKKFPWVEWIDFHSKNNKKNVTIAEQRNVGVLRSSGKVIVFCDAGGSPESGWLLNLTAPLLDGAEVAVGGPIRATNSKAANEWTNAQAAGTEVRYPTTANMALTRTAFDLVGGFNEDLSYGSDADLIWRLNKQGIKQNSVPTAVMGLDGGSAKRERIRAWRYGKAKVDLLLLHKDKRWLIFRSNPELVIYPLLVATPVVLVAAGLKVVGALGITLFLNLILLVKNIRSKNPIHVIANHYIYSAAMVWRLISKASIPLRSPQVLLYPRVNARYLEELSKNLKRQAAIMGNVRIGMYLRLTPSSTLNLLIMPFLSPLLRLRGTKILHLHWVFNFKMLFGFHRLSEFWFKFWILSLRVSGIRLIWTSHNVLPHERVFFDDLRTRAFLVRHCEAVISLSETGKSEVRKLFNPRKLIVIPEGHLSHPTTYNREEFRNTLRVSQEKILCVLLGSLRAYKGVETLMRASSLVDHNIAIRIAGWCSDEDFASLKKILQENSSKKLDIAIERKTLTGNEFGAYLQAADYYVAPFTSVTNSGTINAALTAGLPVVISDLASLKWVPHEVAIRYIPGTDPEKALAKALDMAAGLSPNQVQSLHNSVREFKGFESWEKVASQHLALYEQLLNLRGKEPKIPSEKR